LRVLPGTRVVQAGRRGAGQREGVIEFPIGEESGIAGDGRAVELQLELAVEIESEGVIFAFTHWVPRLFPQEVVENAGFSGQKAQTPCRNDRAIWEIRVHTDGTDTEQRQRADYFNVKELPYAEWVWADCFPLKKPALKWPAVRVGS